MKFFLDTANIEEIKTANSWGVLDGITTNPTLVSKEGKSLKETILEIAKIVDGPISAEVVSLNSEEMIKEGKEYASWNKNVVVKTPSTEDGIRACKALSDIGIKVNVTLVFSANQALLAAKAGAYFVSPFVGRLDDINEDGMQVIRDCVQIFRNYNIKTQILAASIRHPLHVFQAAKAGADIATMPFSVMKQLFKHPLTDIGLKKFLDDWQKVKK